jgi:glycosyltransferase involved in cell wall biosynthesis
VAARQGEANLLMLSGDRSIGQGRQGPFYYTLAGLRRYWRRIDVLCPAARGAGPWQPFENVYVHPARAGRAQQPWFIRQAGRRLFAERSYALVVSHDFGLFYNGIGARLLLRSLPRGSRPPLVSEIFHLPGVPKAAGASEVAGLALHRLYVRASWRALAGFRVINRSMAAQLRRWGVPAERIHVLSAFYLDHSVFQPREAGKEWDVVFCARLVPNKGPALLLDALALLARERPAVRCAIVGEGPLQPALERRAARLGIGERVSFLGWLPSAPDVAALYNRSRLLVCTSYNEGGPRVTLEAMACGLPVVSTPVGIMPEVIVDGQSGFLTGWRAQEVAAKMAWVLADEQGARRIGAAARAAVQQFNYEDELRRYAEAYLRLAGEGP